MLAKIRKSAAYLVPAVMLVLSLVLLQHDPQFLKIFRLKLFDQYQILKPREYKPVPVKILDIDDESLKRLGQWPWPRTTLANMLIRAFESGAAVVAFDVVFAEEDRTSPAKILPIWLDAPEGDLSKIAPEWKDFANAILQSIPDHDAVFADVIAQTRVVSGYTLDDSSTAPPSKPKAGFSHAGMDPTPIIKAFSGATNNLPVVDEAAAGTGIFNLQPEPDNIVRRVSLFLRVGDTKVPALSLEAIRVLQGATTYILKGAGANQEESFGENTGLNNVKVGRIIVPTEGDGRMWVHYSKDVPERWLPIWKLFEPDFDPKTIEGHILFVGTSAAGLKDLRATPLNPAAAGVEVHAQATEQMLLGHYLSRPDWALGAETVAIFLLGTILILITPRVGAAWGAFAGGISAVVGIAASWYAYDEHLMLFDPIYPAISVLAIYLAGSLINFLNTEAEKRFVRGAFAQYLSPALVEQIAENPDLLNLGGARKDLTFLFCDVRGFTAISEQFKGNPAGLTVLINRFLTPMTDIIMARHGTIDKYMGDCIMAFWNAPLDVQKHEHFACESALEMFKGLDELNRTLQEEAAAEGRTARELNIGIGLNTGDCIVGNMGSDQRFDYSVLGDAVNLASRLEGQSKNYGVGVVLGPDTREAVKDEYATIELDLIAVKGKEEAVNIYALLGDKTMRDDPKFQELTRNHDAMITAYRSKQWDEAECLIEQCRKLDGSLEVLYEMYEERLAEYRENPPPEEWDGVFVATSK